MSDYDEESGEEQVYDEEEEVIDDDEAASGEDDGEGEDDEENEDSEGDEEAEELEDGDGESDVEDEEEVEDGEEVDDDEGESEEVEEGDDDEEVVDEEADEEEEEEEEGEDDEEEEEEEEEEGEQLDGDDDDEEEADQEEEEVDDDGEDRELQEGEEEEVEKKDTKKKRPAGGLKKAVGANVIMISGCMDDQTSADGLGTGRPGGACTQALLKSMPRAQNWVDLLKRMYTVLGKAEKPQIPMLTTSRPFDMDAPVEVFQGTGNHKSLFIGINYVGQGANELSGCHADVEAMREFAMKEGFSNDSDHMLVLMDNGRHMMPTRDNILAGFRWLVQDAQPGDSLFMHYSGHGGNVQDLDGDEEDGQDEAMCSVDGLEIVDDDIYQHIINPLQDGVNFTILMDCCHSGSILDLPYTVLCSEHNMRSWDAGTKPQMQANRNFTAKARGSAGQLSMKKPSAFTLARNLAMELGVFCLGKLEAQNSNAATTKATKKTVTKTTTTKKKVVKKATAPDGETASKKVVKKAALKEKVVKKAASDGETTTAVKKAVPKKKKATAKAIDGPVAKKTAATKKTTSKAVRKAPLSSV